MQRTNGEEADKHAEKENKSATDKETKEGSDQNSDKDQESDVSFQDDTDDAIDSTEKEETGLNTSNGVPQMLKNTLDWRMERRLVPLPEERWTMRHVPRTHRVALDCCSIELIWTPKSKSNTSTPKPNSQTF